MPMTKTKPLVLQATWNAPSNIHTLITTCTEDFNLALHVGADENIVLQNRVKLEQFLPSSPLWLNQTHSTTVIDWDSTEYSLFDADASISTDSKKICIVMTADCLPILLTNIRGEFVAAIHAGWRGLNDGIIANTIHKLSQFNISEILAFIGPAINYECFEIGSEVRESFLEKNATDYQFFTPSNNHNKFMANLRGIAAQRLLDIGISINNISNNAICTKCLPEWFFSYRANPQTGRIATMIWRD